MEKIHLLKEIANMTRSGNAYVQLGRAYLMSHEWSKARLSLERALTKEDLDDPGFAYSLLSDVYSKLGNRERARSYLARAAMCDAYSE